MPTFFTRKPVVIYTFRAFLASLLIELLLALLVNLIRNFLNLTLTNEIYIFVNTSYGILYIQFNCQGLEISSSLIIG